MRPFRFGLQTSNAPDAKTWRERARKVEDLGLAALYIPDHFTDQWGPLVALTVAAEATSTLEIGALVFDNDYRHPVVLAKEIATLDLVSEGRVIFGLGAGGCAPTTRSRASPTTSRRCGSTASRRRSTSTRSCCGRARPPSRAPLLDQGRRRAAPACGGRPKLLIGGGGKRVLSHAARHADIVGVNPNLKSGATDQATAQSAVADMVDKRIGWIREAAGERFDDLELQMLTFIVQVGGNGKRWRSMMAPAMGISAAARPRRTSALVGSVEEICDQWWSA
jgi:alkanesulfonate monooxygenase SsuD/methylene tetrahydromethanopterin reductase-like flavin-dependent oxidoreductase (luciferase family)